MTLQDLKIGDYFPGTNNQKVVYKESNQPTMFEQNFSGNFYTISKIDDNNVYLGGTFSGIIYVISISELERVGVIEFPKYYKFILKNNISENFTEGKIYKIVNPYYLNATYNFINNKGKNDGYSNHNEEYFIPSTEEEFNAQNSTKPKYEIGKWYENYPNDHYLKILKIEGNEIKGNAIGSMGTYVEEWEWNLNTNTGKHVLLTDLSKIQQYLPDGHPDKELPTEYIVSCNDVNSREQVKNIFKKYYNYELNIDTNWKYVICKNDLKRGSQCPNGKAIEDFIRPGYSSLPVFTYEKWKELFCKEEFVLPENWCVADSEEVTAYVRLTNPDVGDYNEKAIYFLHNNYEPESGRLYFLQNIEPGYTEITKEQFIKYIVNKKNNQMSTTNKKIIGYKSPIKIGPFEQGSVFMQVISNSYKYYTVDGKPHGDNIQNSVPKEIVETWEAVMEELTLILPLQSSNYNIRVDENKRITISDYEYPISWWNAALEVSKHQKAGVYVGCGAKDTSDSNRWLITHEQIEEVINFVNK